MIFNPVSDPKPMLREAAVNALRAGLVVTIQRETSKQSRHQHQTWYKQCYEQCVKGEKKRWQRWKIRFGSF